MKKGDHLFLVDGSAYIFRAYHALPPLTRKSDGLPINAVMGFCNMLWKLVTDARDTSVGVTPTHFAVIFDHSSKTFRNELYKDYKANRDAPPDDLIPQFALIRDAVHAFDLPCIEKQGFEADDLIATYARLAREAGGDVTIVSSDKDLMQLVGPQVLLYDQMKDKRLGPDEVHEKFGVFPEKMADLQALIGDTSDNVPGIPGIGPKTAAQLLDEFGDLEAVLTNAGQIKQNKRRESILENAEQARLSRRLVELDENTPLETPLEDFRLSPPDGKRLVAFLKAMEFSTLTRRVAEALSMDASQIDAADVDVEPVQPARGPDLDPVSPDGTNGDTGQDEADVYFAGNEGRPPTPSDLVQLRASQVIPVDRSAYVTITQEAELKAWIARIVDQGCVAVDVETDSLDAMSARLCGISLALSPGEAAYVPFGHRQAGSEGDMFETGSGELLSGQLDEEKVLALLGPVLEDSAILKIGQNFKYDWLVLHRRGIDTVSVDDTLLLSYALDAGFGQNHGMDILSQRWLGHTPLTFKEVCGSGRSQIGFDRVELDRATEYAAEDADITLRLWLLLKPRLAAEGMVSVYERLERPLIPVLARMEERGIATDRQILSRLSGKFAQKAAGLEQEISDLAGETFNIGSPKQLGEILFGKMGLPGGRKTPTGQWSTDVKVLEDLAIEGHELPVKIVGWRQLTKLKNTYTDALVEYRDEDGRVHTSYSLASTTTGRLSSSDPNLQNIPVRTEEGREIRTAFVSGKGRSLISADYSQIELRILAHMADIPQLKEAFAEGQDIHALTASEMFGVPVKDMPAEVRRRAKAINFGIIYGISAFGLANQLGIGRSEAGEYIKRYFERFPGILDYMETTKKTAREKGYVSTLFGRKIHFDNIRASNASIRAGAERAAINAPIQGTAADIIRRAMIRMEPALEEAGVEVDMLLQVHDELIFEAPDTETARAIPIITQVMEGAAMPAISLSVPLQVDARAARNWDEAH